MKNVSHYVEYILMFCFSTYWFQPTKPISVYKSIGTLFSENNLPTEELVFPKQLARRFSRHLWRG